MPGVELGAGLVEVEELEPPPQPEREAAAMAIAEQIASERTKLRWRRRPGNRPKRRAKRASVGSVGRTTEALPPGAVEAMAMVPVTTPFAGRVTVEAVKEQVGTRLGVPLPVKVTVQLWVMTPEKLPNEV